MRPASIVASVLAPFALAACASPSTAEEQDQAAAEALATYEPPPAYAEGKLHSDLTPEVVANLKSIHAHATGDDHAFIKVGDSITYSTSFLNCLSTHAASAPDLEETRTFFHGTSWARRSIASTVGWHTNQPLQGNPSYLAREIAEMHPTFAVVMLGTNDLYEGTQTSYERNLTKLVTTIAAQGIVPILSTVPPIRDATENAVVPKVNLIVRKVAAEQRLPLMDFHATLVDLPRYGLSGDGVHPAEASTGACDFSETALRSGYNQRNLLALTALDRARRATLE